MGRSDCYCAYGSFAPYLGHCDRAGELLKADIAFGKLIDRTCYVAAFASDGSEGNLP